MPCQNAAPLVPSLRGQAGSAPTARHALLQDQTDEVQQQPGWMQDGEGEETGESSPLPAVPLPGQSRPQQPASQPSGDLLSLGGDTPRATADGNLPQSEWRQAACVCGEALPAAGYLCVGAASAPLGCKAPSLAGCCSPCMVLCLQRCLTCLNKQLGQLAGRAVLTAGVPAGPAAPADPMAELYSLGAPPPAQPPASSGMFCSTPTTLLLKCPQLGPGTRVLCRSCSGL